MVTAPRGNSTTARACQNVLASFIIPAHQIRMDRQMAHDHRLRIVNMGGRDVAVLLDLLQGLDQSRFMRVCHCAGRWCQRTIPSRAGRALEQ